MKKNLHRLITAAALIILLLSSTAGCIDLFPWSTYTSKNHNYSIEYPRKWSATEPFSGQMVMIKSPDESETISVLASDSKGMALDQVVNYYVYLTQQGGYSYKIVSDSNVAFQGIPARELDVVYQSQKDSPVLTVKELYLINNGQYYLVRFSTKQSDLTPLAATYQHVFSSFKIINPEGR